MLFKNTYDFESNQAHMPREQLSYIFYSIVGPRPEFPAKKSFSHHYFMLIPAQEFPPWNELNGRLSFYSCFSTFN